MYSGADAQSVVVERLHEGGDSLGRVLAGEGLHIERGSRSTARVAADASGKRATGTAAAFFGCYFGVLSHRAGSDRRLVPSINPASTGHESCMTRLAVHQSGAQSDPGEHYRFVR